MRKLLAFCWVGILLLTLSACGTKTTSADNTPASAANAVTVGLTYIPNIQFAPIYVAQEQGLFQAEDLQVTIRHHGAQEALFGALQEGKEDIVFAGLDEMLQAQSTGIDVVSWATMYQQYPVVLVAAQDAGISTWADLSGKKIGLPGPYGENYYGLLAALQLHGLTDKVEIAYIGYTQTTALLEKQVDAIIGFSNNDPVALENAGIKTVTLPLAKAEDLPLISVGFGSMREKIAPAVYKKFLRAVEKAVQLMEADPQLALDITAKYVPTLQTDPVAQKTAQEVLTKTLALYQGGAEFGAIDTKRYAKMSEFLLQQGIITQAVKPTRGYTLAVLEHK